MERREADFTFIPTEGRDTSITVGIVPRHVEIYLLLGEELDAIAGGAHSIHLTLFGISIGALIALVITLGTGQVTAALAFSGFVGASVAAFGLSTPVRTTGPARLAPSPSAHTEYQASAPASGLTSRYGEGAGPGRETIRTSSRYGRPAASAS